MIKTNSKRAVVFAVFAIVVILSAFCFTAEKAAVDSESQNPSSYAQLVDETVLPEPMTWDVSATESDSVWADLHPMTDEDGVVYYFLSIYGSGNMGYIPWCEFSPQIIDVYISDGVTSICDAAFSFCENLTSVEIPSSVTSIGSQAFLRCDSLTSVEIPSSVTSIGYEPFCLCYSLTSITVDEKNTAYKSIDGNLYTNDEKTLIQYAIGKTDSSFTVPDSVTTISQWAFASCTSLTSIVIPDGVTSIGDRAFCDCTSLTSIVIPDSVTSIGYDAFSYCTSLTSVEIPSSVTSIGSQAFFRCDSLTSIVIPDGVTSIGDDTFAHCTSLTSVVIPDNVTFIGPRAFEYCTSLTSIVIPDGVTSIGDDTFAHCTSLTSIEIPDSITSIGDDAFYHCTSLTSIVIPDSVTSIGAYAFSGCTSLTSIVIPDSVTSIGAYAFSGCTSLTSIVIPDSVESIGFWAFNDCTNLTIYCEAASQPEGWNADWNPVPCPVVWGYGSEPEEILGKLVEEWDVSASADDSVTARLYADPENEGYYKLVISGSGAMKNYGYASAVPWYSFFSDNGDKITADKIGAAIIEDGVTSIGNYAFSGCTSLISVTIGNSVTYIGSYAFGSCESLTSVTIPDSVTSIGSYSFWNCTRLATVTLGNSVANIGAFAFSNCTVLSSIVIPASVSSLGEGGTFSTCTSLASIVVDEANKVYKSIDGNLYTKDGKTLVHYAIGKSETSFVIPDGVTAVSAAAFYGCENLVSVTIGNDLASIGNFAFRRCSALLSIVIPSNVTYIGSSVFYECAMLESVTISANVTSVGDWMFAYCTSLSNVLISSEVTSIDEYAFLDCNSLTGIVIPDSVTSIGKSAFAGCRTLAKVIIPSNVTSIGTGAFSSCEKLKEVIIPNAVTSIASTVFSGCTSLESVVIPNGVTSIGSSAFQYCESLKSIVIPKSVVTVDSYVFYKCASLTIYCEAESQPTGWNAKWNPVPCPVVWGYVRVNVLTNLTLGSMLSVNAFVNVDDAEGVTVRFTMGEKIATVSGVYDAGTGRYKFTFEGVWPTNIGDTIVIEVFKDGTLIASVNDYSVKGYCENLLGMSKEELGLSDAKYAAIRTLICDLLDYGAAAQKYTDYKTDALVNEGIEGSSEFSPLTWTDMKVSYHKTVDGVRFTAANLYFNNANQLIFKFRATDVEKLTLRLFVNGVITYYTADDFVNNDGVYSFYTDKIRATEFDDVYYATLIYDAVEVQTLAYSVRSYVYSKQSASNTTLAELVRATYKYGLSAKTYAQAN
ncbi:MAG: leucine-rich repeat domain-containing protein [Clostridia bacterium]|nr:leucine-rich repeat domain-containing protein [Clostridia bacterium]